MSRSWDTIKRSAQLTAILLAAVLLLQRSVLEPGDKIEQVRAFTRQIEFDYATWALDALWVKLEQIGLGAADYISEEDQPQIVLDYLDLVVRIQRAEGFLDDYYADPNLVDPEAASLLLRRDLAGLYAQREQQAPLAESIIQSQLGAVVADLGLTIGGQAIPPVLYHVTPLPLALIVSPREVIRQDADVSLHPDITVDQRAALEEQVDQSLDVSSLIVNIGGVGLYPTMVMQTSNINWLAEVVSHEWTHNILTLRPLGASYYVSPELRTMNETAANISGKEIGAAIIARFYPQFVPPPPDESAEPAPPASTTLNTETEPPPFDFRDAMHATRVTADELLAAGKIEEAEAYMEARRLVFWENGYRIRKLNQAYFAFHGAYADLPGGAAGEDPVGAAVRELRAQSPSLATFLNRMSWLWTFEQLQAAVVEEK